MLSIQQVDSKCSLYRVNLKSPLKDSLLCYSTVTGSSEAGRHCYPLPLLQIRLYCLCLVRLLDTPAAVCLAIFSWTERSSVEVEGTHFLLETVRGKGPKWGFDVETYE